MFMNEEEFESIENENEDDDLEIFLENEDDDLDISIELDDRKIIWQAKDFSIREFQSMNNDNELILQPDYQRNYVASNKIASRLIESILLDVPIPVIYLAEEQDGTLSVIDGQQRLTTFVSFLYGKFPDNRDFRLSSLNILSDLNRKKFTELSIEQQKKIRSTTIHSIVIKKESNPDIKFEIFERLNTGSTKLNENEIRNNLYRGSYMDLTKELAENEILDRLVNKNNLKKRMGYSGLVLRFLSISERSYINYKSPMKQFCNKELRDNKNLTSSKIKEFKERFKHCIELCDIVFGDTSFKKYTYKKDDGFGSWNKELNTALFDIQMCGFVNFTKNQIMSKLDHIRDGLLELFISNEDFIDSISNKTNNVESVKKRFKIYMDMLENIISSPTPRTFDYSLKKELFNKNPICSISGQNILKIEDCEIDHIIPYSKGGETTIENAQLTLRYFNRHKKDNYDVNLK
jgi:uncharacterized protein with ParB-like and HNH nuclease domain